MGEDSANNQWDNNHHIVWSNDRQIQHDSNKHTRLNPVHLRSYFDRVRIPAPGTRSSQTCLGKVNSANERHTTQVLPVWRLDGDPTASAPSAGNGSTQDNNASNTKHMIWNSRHQ